jgi:nucleotide-binding universal stress UspA family protein
MFTRLLVPLDGSRMAETALPIVEQLATINSASVILLHVIERGAPATVHGDRHLTAVNEANAYLDVVATDLRAMGIQVTAHTHEVPQGDVAHSIADHAEEGNADLIVLCTHGHSRVKELVYGSIAQQVLRRGTTPVLLARPAEDGLPLPFSPQTVLVPLDATEAAEAALVPAEYLARALHACMHLVMVVSTQDRERRPAATLLPRTSQAILEMEEHDAAGYLERLAVALRAPDLPITTEVRRGDAASALADEAQEPGVGLVVVATHGRSGLQAIWAGSVSVGLLARTHAPVLLMRRIDA